MVKRRITWISTAVAAVTASRSQPGTLADGAGFRPVPGPPERPVLGDPERLALERLRPASLRTASSSGDPALHSRLLFSLIPAHLPNTRPKSSTGKRHHIPLMDEAGQEI